MFQQVWWSYFVSFFLGCFSLMAQASGNFLAGDPAKILTISGIIIGLQIKKITQAAPQLLLFILGYISPLFVKMLISKNIPNEVGEIIQNTLVATLAFGFTGILVGYILQFCVRKFHKKYKHHLKGRTSYKT